MQEQILFTSEQLSNTHRIIGHIHAVGCPHQLIQTEFMPDVIQFFSFGQLQSALQFMETLTAATAAIHKSTPQKNAACCSKKAHPFSGKYTIP